MWSATAALRCAQPAPPLYRGCEQAGTLAGRGGRLGEGLFRAEPRPPTAPVAWNRCRKATPTEERTPPGTCLPAGRCPCHAASTLCSWTSPAAAGASSPSSSPSSSATSRPTTGNGEDTGSNGPRTPWAKLRRCSRSGAWPRAGRRPPPYPNGRDYHAALRTHAGDLCGAKARLPANTTPARWVRANRHALGKDPYRHDLNRIPAYQLLLALEKSPSGWQAVTHLNRLGLPKSATLDAVPRRWHAACPDAHKEFVGEIPRTFGVPPGPPGSTTQPAPARTEVERPDVEAGP